MLLSGLSRDEGASALLEDSANSPVMFEEMESLFCRNPWTILDLHTADHSNSYIAKGGQGTVWKVQRGTGPVETLALKVPNTPGDRQDIADEARIMEAASSDGTMPLLESNPCLKIPTTPSSKMARQMTFLHDSNFQMPQDFTSGLFKFRVPGSYLTTLMKADLHSWINKASSSMIKRCGEMIAETLGDALFDFHGSGFIHGDLKADNILFEDLYPSNHPSYPDCPRGLRLTDFGLSGKIGEPDTRFSHDHYAGSNHLPGCVFDNSGCNLDGVSIDSNAIRTCTQTCPRGAWWSKLDVAPLVCLCNGYALGEDSFYKRDPSIDICSLTTLIYEVFGFAPSFSTLQVGAATGSCGPMGVGRRTVVDLTGERTVVHL